MKFGFPVIFVFLLVIFSSATGQKRSDRARTNFKIVGYYFLNEAIKDTSYADSNYIFLEKITHLNIAFINPDSTGKFAQNIAIDSLVEKAHKRKVKVLASIAGGGPHPYYAILLGDDKRQVFVKNLVSLVQKYNLDGIDVDLEGSDIDSHYESFVLELKASLKPLHKLVTAAIATAYKDQLSDKALKAFDFVSIMSYDRTGPWNPANPGHHSPYTMAVQDLDYWKGTRLMPKAKIVLGLPFYGYGFGARDSPVISLNYKEIVSFYPGNQTSDTLNLPGNVVLFYNTISTIKKKTHLAFEKAGGVMIWQLLGDAPGNNSLLNAIFSITKTSLNKNSYENNTRKKDSR